jgi:phytoene synthase
MQDAFDHCAELVRTADRDRYLAALFAPAENRGALHALYAFNVEVARVRDVAREPLPGEIRLQWWRDVLDGERNEEARANPVAAALLATVERYNLPASKLIALIEAHRFDLYDEPMASVADLEDYARATSSALIALAGQILGVEAEAVAEPAGIAHGMLGVLRAFPRHAARRQLYVPLELLGRHHVGLEDVFSLRSSDSLRAALGELSSLIRQRLDVARERVTALPSEALPAFLPVALARPMLDRLGRCDPFAPADISPWRRQWLIWRAARNPLRITG